MKMTGRTGQIGHSDSKVFFEVIFYSIFFIQKKTVFHGLRNGQEPTLGTQISYEIPEIFMKKVHPIAEKVSSSECTSSLQLF